MCQRRGDRHAFLCAFDLLELNGKTLRREPIEVLRKAALEKLLLRTRPGLQLNEHIDDVPGPRHLYVEGLDGRTPRPSLCSAEHEALMSIRPYLNGQRFDPETTRILGVAFEMVCIALQTEGADDFVKQAIATKIIDLAKAGERNPDLLCEQVLKNIRGQEVSWT